MNYSRLDAVVVKCEVDLSRGLIVTVLGVGVALVELM